MEKFDLGEDQRNTSEPGAMIIVLYHNRVDIQFSIHSFPFKSIIFYCFQDINFYYPWR